MITNNYLTTKKLNAFRVSKICLTLVVLFLTGNLLAQETPELVSDNFANPTELTEFDGELYFSATSTMNLGETNLWKTDGTESGTKEYVPTGKTVAGYKPERITKYDNKLIFSGLFTDKGREILDFDKTRSTKIDIVKDINSSGSSTPINFTNLDGYLYFQAEDNDRGVELWRTDGTEMGTNLVKDINSGVNNSFPNEFTEFDNKLYFSATNGIRENGKELWVTDGTESGTEMVKDINSGADPSFPEGFTEFDGKLFFRADNGTDGYELWVTDGTESGTEMLKDINQGSGKSTPNHFTEFDDKLYFVADDGNNGRELWVTDGTVSGTVMLKDINQGSESSSPYMFTVFNDKLYFIADDGTSGRELWVTDGTTGGTQLFKDINPGSDDAFPATGASSLSYHFTEYNGRFYFSADGGTNGVQLWESDGTPEGTVVVQPDVAGNSNPLEEWPNPNIVYDNSFYFAADFDGNGKRLYKLTTEHLSVDEYTEDQFTLYPNPVEDVLNIETKTGNIQTIELFSITGQRLQTWEGQSEIDLSSYSAGNYFVKISTADNQTVTKQIIKK